LGWESNSNLITLNSAIRDPSRKAGNWTVASNQKSHEPSRAGAERVVRRERGIVNF